MIEHQQTETSQAAAQDLEPIPEYRVGDVVTLKDSAKAAAVYVISHPAYESSEGLLARGIELDENGKGLTDGGTIHIEDITSVIGHMTAEEVIELYADVLNDKYPTLDKEIIARLAAETLGLSV